MGIINMKTFAITIGLVAITHAKCQTDTELIKQGEGLELCEYMDTTGNRTICYGFNLETMSTTVDVSQRVSAILYSTPRLMLPDKVRSKFMATLSVVSVDSTCWLT